ncbi:MAG: exodeoxyribonuclease VII small subunit [Nitrospiraceae bacterium]|nr:exodeoxyribonuclease VII small subunit [Nitrospiraceae bacterium]
MENKLTYSKAATELEAIVKEIEEENIAVDTLSDKVKRAAQLIKFCRGKLRGTEEEVEKVLADLEAKTPGKVEDDSF